MPYITRIHVGQCRNVRDLDIDLSVPSGEEGAPESTERVNKPFRHLILTGPNGSGKSGILEAVARALKASNASTDANHTCELVWSAGWPEIQAGFAKGEMVAVYVPPSRRIRRAEVAGPAKLDLDPNVILPEQELSQKFIQFLVNKQFELALATSSGDAAAADRIKRWFSDLEQHMRWMTGDAHLQMIFRAKSFNFYFQRGDGYTFDLSTLADGHAAVLALLAEILLRIEAVQVARDDFTFNPDGVVIVDEIETHLHLKLQEQILPFMTELFPKLQLLVATHSPAVIASIPGAVVCDLGTREQAPSELYRGVPYGALMKEHFGLSSDIDLESTGWLLELRELATLDKRTPEQERRFDELARKLSARSAVLATEVWMIRNRIGGSHVQVGGQRS